MHTCICRRGVSGEGALARTDICTAVKSQSAFIDSREFHRKTSSAGQLIFQGGSAPLPSRLD
eukprot:1142795-Pelagomonas_calceolata.AAC.3